MKDILINIFTYIMYELFEILKYFIIFLFLLFLLSFIDFLFNNISSFFKKIFNKYKSKNKTFDNNDNKII